MATGSIREQLADVAFTTATPFDDDGDVDHDALSANLEGLHDAGARLFLACGNTGEYDALTADERAAVVRTHVETLADREGVTILGGVGGSTRSAIALARRYESIGAQGILAMPPAFTYAHADGLRTHYRRLARATSLDLVLYTRGSVPESVIADLTADRAVTGVKYADADVASFAAVKRRAEGDVAWLNGLAERYGPAFNAEGAVGYTTGIGNFAPRLTLDLFSALRAGDRVEVADLQELIWPIEALRQESGAGNELPAANNVPVVKRGMVLRGYAGGRCRPPLVAIDDADEQRLRAALEELEAAGY